MIGSSFLVRDLGKPVIAEVRGYELATACDLVYSAEDTQIVLLVWLITSREVQLHASLSGMRDTIEMMPTADSIRVAKAAEKGFFYRPPLEAQLEQ